MSEPKKGVNFCLIKDGMILLQQRDEHCPYHPLQWCIPGGAQDPGETFRETALREIEEEYNLSILPDSCVFLTVRPANNPGEVYVCTVPKDQEPILHEGKSMAWVPIENLTKMELGFNHNEFIVPLLIEYIDEHSQEYMAEAKPTGHEFRGGLS